MRILVTEFRQESNSFNPINADLAFWAQSGIYEGDEARQAWGSKPCAIAGILDVLDRAPEHPEVVVATVMSCQSGGVAEQEVMDYYWERLEQSLRENLPLAAVVVSFHGALMTTQFDDPEGELTRRIREIVGGSCVISIATDLHGYGLTPFRRSSRYESRPVARGRGQGDWSDHDEQQEASHPGAGRP